MDRPAFTRLLGHTMDILERICPDEGLSVGSATTAGRLASKRIGAWLSDREGSIVLLAGLLLEARDRLVSMWATPLLELIIDDGAVTEPRTLSWCHLMLLNALSYQHEWKRIADAWHEILGQIASLGVRSHFVNAANVIREAILHLGDARALDKLEEVASSLLEDLPGKPEEEEVARFFEPMAEYHAMKGLLAQEGGRHVQDLDAAYHLLRIQLSFCRKAGLVYDYMEAVQRLATVCEKLGRVEESKKYYAEHYEMMERTGFLDVMARQSPDCAAWVYRKATANDRQE